MTHMNRTPDKDMPAAQLMHAAQPALTEQQTLLEEQRVVLATMSSGSGGPYD